MIPLGMHDMKIVTEFGEGELLTTALICWNQKWFYSTSFWVFGEEKSKAHHLSELAALEYHLRTALARRDRLPGLGRSGTTVMQPDSPVPPCYSSGVYCAGLHVCWTEDQVLTDKQNLL